MNTTTETIKHEDYVKPKFEALAKHLGCEVDDITEMKYGHYGLTLVEAEGAEYAIGYDAECDDACREYVEQSAWAFNAYFIIEQCDLPHELTEAIQSMQENKCEGANDAILALINKCTDINEFTQCAIGADGRGHFLSSYDSNEIELENNIFAYRTN